MKASRPAIYAQQFSSDFPNFVEKSNNGGLVPSYLIPVHCTFHLLPFLLNAGCLPKPKKKWCVPPSCEFIGPLFFVRDSESRKRLFSCVRSMCDDKHEDQRSQKRVFKLRSAPILLQQLGEKHQGESKITVHDFLSLVFTVNWCTCNSTTIPSHLFSCQLEIVIGTQNLVSKQLYSYQLFRKISI